MPAMWKVALSINVPEYKQIAPCASHSSLLPVSTSWMKSFLEIPFHVFFGKLQREKEIDASKLAKLTSLSAKLTNHDACCETEKWTYFSRCFKLRPFIGEICVYFLSREDFNNELKYVGKCFFFLFTVKRLSSSSSQVISMSWGSIFSSIEISSIVISQRQILLAPPKN